MLIINTNGPLHTTRANKRAESRSLFCIKTILDNGLTNLDYSR